MFIFGKNEPAPVKQREIDRMAIPRVVSVMEKFAADGSESETLRIEVRYADGYEEDRRIREEIGRENNIFVLD